MNCCDKPSSFLAIVILVLALWPNLIGAAASKWVIVVAAVLILISACKMSCPMGPMAKAKPARKAKKGKRR